jgi:hypothetical protein
MKKIYNWLFTNYKGETLSQAWFAFNIVSSVLLILGLLTIIFR